MRGFVQKSEKFPKRKRFFAEYRAFAPVGTKGANKGTLVATGNRNCQFGGGTLSCGVGVTEYFLHFNTAATLPKIPSSYGKALRFFSLQWTDGSGNKKDSIGALAENQRLFIYDEDLDAFKMISSDAKFVTVRNFYDSSDFERLLFCGQKEAYAYDLVNLKKWIFKTTPLSAACPFKERIFFGSGYTLKFSSPMTYDNFTDSIYEGGNLRLPSESGDIVALESLGEYLYIFREFGIMRLSAFGEACDFEIRTVPYKGARILGSSVCAFEDKIFFLAYDGIYSFDGGNVRQIGKELGVLPLREEQLCATGYFDGKAYFTFTDRFGEKRTVFLDLRDDRNFGETFVMHGLSVSHGRAIVDNERTTSYLAQDGDLPSGEEYRFEAAKTDFGVPGMKVLRSVEIFGVGECTLSVVGERGSRTENFALDSVEKKKFFVKGEAFGLKILLQKGCAIEKIVVEFDEIGGRR